MRRRPLVRSLWAVAGAVALTVTAGGRAWGTATGQGTATGHGAAVTGPNLAVISYWDPAEFARLPSGSLAVVNPADGIVGADAATVAAFKQAVRTARARDVRFLGYVPTGYGDRRSGHPNGEGSVGQSLADIRRQISLYASTFGTATLDGIFFDETSQSCSSAARDYPTLSAAVRAAGLQRSAFNPGWVGDGYCFVDATPRGDVVVTFESTLDAYLTDPSLETDLRTANQRAHAKGARTWHLVDAAPGTGGLAKALAALRRRGPDLAYVTDIGENWQAGENTWGSPPGYWTAEVQCLTGSSCPVTG